MTEWVEVVVVVCGCVCGGGTVRASVHSRLSTTGLSWRRGQGHKLQHACHWMPAALAAASVQPRRTCLYRSTHADVTLDVQMGWLCLPT